MNLCDFLSERLIVADLKATGKLAVLGEAATMISRAYEGLNADGIARALLDRERIASTAVGDGVAIPHAKTPAVDRIIAFLGISRAGIDFDAEDGSLTHIFFALIAPAGSGGEHLRVLARISRLCQCVDFREQLIARGSAHEILGVIRQMEESL